MLEEEQRRLVRPLQVLEQEQQRLHSRRAIEELGEAAEEIGPSLRWRQVEGRWQIGINAAKSSRGGETIGGRIRPVRLKCGGGFPAVAVQILGERSFIRSL